MTRCYYAFPASNPSRQPFTLGQRWPHSPVLNSLIPQQSVPEPLLPLLTPASDHPITGSPDHPIWQVGGPPPSTPNPKDLADSTPGLTSPQPCQKCEQRNGIPPLRLYSQLPPLLTESRSGGQGNNIKHILPDLRPWINCPFGHDPS